MFKCVNKSFIHSKVQKVPANCVKENSCGDLFHKNLLSKEIFWSNFFLR